MKAEELLGRMADDLRATNPGAGAVARSSVDTWAPPTLEALLRLSADERDLLFAEMNVDRIVHRYRTEAQQLAPGEFNRVLMFLAGLFRSIARVLAYRVGH